MFVHKSMPLALGFAATMVLSFSAGAAQADRQQDSYCSAPAVCNQRQIGIIQKTRDGVNYFYGGSDVPPPQISYIYVRDDDIDQPGYEPVYEPVFEPFRSSDLYTTSFAAPLSNHRFSNHRFSNHRFSNHRFSNHRFRMKEDHWKWHRRHPGPLGLPGLNAGGKYLGH